MAVGVDGTARELMPREYALLETLARRPGLVFTRERLLDLAWPDDKDIVDRRVGVHVSRLRRKLGAAANIRTVSGTGYALDPPDED